MLALVGAFKVPRREEGSAAAVVYVAALGDVAAYGCASRVAVRATEFAPALHRFGYVEPLAVRVLGHLWAERGTILVYPERGAD